MTKPLSIDLLDRVVALAYRRRVATSGTHFMEIEVGIAEIMRTGRFRAVHVRT